LCFAQAICIAKRSQDSIVCVDEFFPGTHLFLHLRTNMIDDLVIKTFQHDTAVMEILDDVINMVLRQFNHK
jgi:hypothetical protein